jgi:hypothetical protein
MRDLVSKPASAIFSSTERTITTDAATGEILHDAKVIREVTRKDGASYLTFTKMFYADLGRLYGLSRSAMVLFIELGSMVKDDQNQVIITPLERKEITQRTGLKNQVIYNATRELITSGLLLRVVNGVYMIDPNIFAVGTDPRVLENRRKFNDLRKIRMQIEYTEEGRSISVSAE